MILVLGTQNPINSDGTYRLPDSQMDRFSLRLTLGYPNYAFEKADFNASAIKSYNKIIFQTGSYKITKSLVDKVYVDDKILNYIS